MTQRDGLVPLKTLPLIRPRDSCWRLIALGRRTRGNPEGEPAPGQTRKAQEGEAVQGLGCVDTERNGRLILEGNYYFCFKLLGK